MKKHSILSAAALLLSSTLVYAAGDQCAVEIEGNDQLQFDKKELVIPASCDEATVTLKHVGKMPRTAMGHNWVLTETKDFKAVAQAGMGAGLSNEYLPKGDERILASTKIIGGGEEVSITIKTADLKGKDLTYFCSFPGHFAIMNGKFIIK